MSKELAPQNSLAIEIAGEGFSRAQLEVLKKTLSPDGISDAELSLFIATAKRLGLDPFANQLQAIRFQEKNPDGSPGAVSAYPTWEGRVALAERTGEFQGMEGPYFTGDGKDWSEVWLESTPPAAAKVGVYRAGFKAPLWATVRWKSFVRTKANGEPMYMWKKMPDHMLGQAAIRLALKRAFPFIMPGAERMPEPIEGQDVTDAETPVNNAQLKALHTLAHKLQLDDEDRHGFAAIVLEKTVESFGDLTEEEATAVLDAMAVEVKNRAETAEAEEAEIIEDPFEEIVAKPDKSTGWGQYDEQAASSPSNLEAEVEEGAVGVGEVPTAPFPYLDALPPAIGERIIAVFGERVKLAEAYVRGFVKRRKKDSSSELIESELEELAATAEANAG